MAAAVAVESSSAGSKKLRILLVPFFATSHIGPHADLAVRLVAAGRPGCVVEPTVAVTPANYAVVLAALERHGAAASSAVGVATYPFPDVEGLPPGVENLSSTTAADAWRIGAVAIDEAALRPAQEALIRELSPDAIVSDMHFYWNSVVAGELGVPCVTFNPIGTFSTLAMRHLSGAVEHDDDGCLAADEEVVVPDFPGPEIRIPTTELPEFLRHRIQNPALAGHRRCFGLVVNTFFDLEQQYCSLLTSKGYEKRSYFVGPLSPPPPPPPPPAVSGGEPCMEWLSSKPSRSVVYVCFGSLAHVSHEQLSEMALALEVAGKPFLWVVRDAGGGGGWAPPPGWEEKVGDNGMVVRGWAPQTAVLAHPAVGVFVTHCGWNSVLEAVVAGVPVLTWPMVFEQFITERFVTQVLGTGGRLSAAEGVRRSTRFEEKELVPAEAVARALAGFMEETGCGGDGSAGVARGKATELAARARAAVADGGSSWNDLRRLVDDLAGARDAAAAVLEC